MIPARARPPVQPGSGPASRSGRASRLTRLQGGALLLAFVCVATLLGPSLLDVGPLDQDYRARYARPSIAHPLGTDSLGRDVLARSLVGGRTSLAIGVSGAGLALVLGTLSGLLAAGAAPFPRTILTRAFDALLAFPGFLLVLLIVAGFGGGTLQTVIALGVAGSPLFFRLARAAARSELSLDYVLAGTALGASPARLLFRHALPNLRGPLLVQAASTAAAFLLVEATLSYLGLGVPLPTPSWGNVLQDARGYLTRQPWAALGPGVFLIASALGLQMVSDGIQRRGRAGARDR